MGTRQPIVYAVISEASVAPFAVNGAPPLRLFDDVLGDIQSGKLPVEAIILRENDRELAPEIAQRLVHLYFTGVPDLHARAIPPSSMAKNPPLPAESDVATSKKDSKSHASPSLND